jgi:iron-sulfur cluster assembly protein
MKSLRLSLEQGEILLDRLLKDGVGIAHDCEGTGAYASCRVVVREGIECLNAANDDELDMLERSRAGAPGARLACQVSGAGEVLIELPRGEAPVHAAMLPVSVSERAAEHFVGQLAKHPGAVAVRLLVEPSGCSGHRYRIQPADGVRDEDSVFESSGVRIVVDGASLPYLQGATLDVVHEGLSRRVSFDNPNVRESCGCGESFGV